MIAIIDLRSDTVTRPTAQMRAAIAARHRMSIGLVEGWPPRCFSERRREIGSR